MATKQQVEQKLRELIERLAATDKAQESLSGSLPDPRVIAVQVTDLQADYWTEMVDGRMGDLVEGAPDRADIQLRAPADALIDVIDGNVSMLSAVLGGRIKVQASLSDLLSLRRLG